ncbi:MAG: hypothetical protein M0Z31_11340 [Clostridia bacterium]|nr:hypothetical protein [Clostridia bacterium]
MNKYLYLFACMAISLALLAGCTNDGNSTSAGGMENTLTQTATSQAVDRTEWKPTPYKTVNNFDGVTMTLKEGTTSSVGLTVAFKNNSKSKFIYGDDFWLEKKSKGGWYQVPVAIDDNYAFNDIGYNLVSRGAGEWAVDWRWLYGSLDTGEYRIVKDISDFRGPGEYDTYNLAAEFTIY